MATCALNEKQIELLYKLTVLAMQGAADRGDTFGNDSVKALMTQVYTMVRRSTNDPVKGALFAQAIPAIIEKARSARSFSRILTEVNFNPTNFSQISQRVSDPQNGLLETFKFIGITNTAATKGSTAPAPAVITINTAWTSLPKELLDELQPEFDNYIKTPDFKNTYGDYETLSEDKKIAIKQLWLKDQGAAIDAYNQKNKPAQQAPTSISLETYPNINISDKTTLYELENLRAQMSRLLNQTKNLGLKEKYTRDLEKLDSLINSRKQAAATAFPLKTLLNQLESGLQTLKNLFKGKTESGYQLGDKILNRATRLVQNVLKERFEYVFDLSGSTQTINGIQSQLGKKINSFEDFKREFSSGVFLPIAITAKKENKVYSGFLDFSDARKERFFNAVKREIFDSGVFDPSDIEGTKRKTASRITDILIDMSYQEASVAGTVTDEVIRTILDGEDVDLTQEIELYRNEPKVKLSDYITEKAVADIRVLLQPILQSIERGEMQVISKHNVIYDVAGLKAAGEFDILLLDKDGNIKVLDIKTSKEDSWKIFGKERKSDDEYRKKKSSLTQKLIPAEAVLYRDRGKLVGYTLQQLLYKNMIFNIFGVEAKISLLPISLEYDSEGKVLSAERSDTIFTTGVSEDKIRVDFELDPNLEAYDVQKEENVTLQSVADELVPRVAPAVKLGDPNFVIPGQAAPTAPTAPAAPAAPAAEAAAVEAALADVESTSKALKSLESGDVQFVFRDIYKGGTVNSNGVQGLYRDEQKSEFISLDEISEAYHAAKKDESNPELVKALEDLISRGAIFKAFTAETFTKKTPTATSTPAGTAPVTEDLTVLEKEKLQITSEEFDRLTELAKFFLENPKEPDTRNSLRTKYPNLFKAITKIEKERQEKLEAYKLKKDGTPKNENELTKVYAIEDVKNINNEYDAQLAALESTSAGTASTAPVTIESERDSFIEAFQRLNPDTQDQQLDLILDGMSDNDIEIYEKILNNEEVPLGDAVRASNNVYTALRRISAQKKNPETRFLTLAQLQPVEEDLNRMLDVLETYVQEPFTIFDQQGFLDQVVEEVVEEEVIPSKLKGSTVFENIGVNVLYQGGVGEIMQTANGEFVFFDFELDKAVVLTNNGDTTLLELGIEEISKGDSIFGVQIVENQRFTLSEQTDTTVKINGVDYTINTDAAGNVQSLSFKTNQRTIDNLNKELEELNKQIDSQTEFVNTQTTNFSNLSKAEQRDLVLKGYNIGEAQLKLNQLLAQRAALETRIDKAEATNFNVDTRNNILVNLVNQTYKKAKKKLEGNKQEAFDAMTDIDSNGTEALLQFFDSSFPAGVFEKLFTSDVNAILESDILTALSWLRDTITKIEDTLQAGDLTTQERLENLKDVLSSLANNLVKIKYNKDGKITKRGKTSTEVIQGIRSTIPNLASSLSDASNIQPGTAPGDTTKTQSEIDAAKADIQRRRKISTTSNKNAEAIDGMSTIIPDGTEGYYYDANGNEEVVSGENLEDTKAKLNAKYDAELDALEGEGAEVLTGEEVEDVDKTTPVVKIISGGQTGVDRLGLEIAKELGIETGGVAPKNYKTEKGADPSLKEFGLSEDESSEYNSRTEKNVKASDATVIFGDATSAGTKLTISLLKKNNKPYIINPSAKQLSDFLKDNNVKVLNVAGNRGSKLSASQVEKYKNTLRTALQTPQLDTTAGKKINDFEKLKSEIESSSIDELYKFSSMIAQLQDKNLLTEDEANELYSLLDTRESSSTDPVTPTNLEVDNILVEKGFSVLNTGRLWKVTKVDGKNVTLKSILNSTTKTIPLAEVNSQYEEKYNPKKAEAISKVKISNEDVALLKDTADALAVMNPTEAVNEALRDIEKSNITDLLSTLANNSKSCD